MTVLSKSGNWNENNLNPLSGINWRESLVQVAAAITAPIECIKVVAVKNIVVGLLVVVIGPKLCVDTRIISRNTWGETVYN